MTPEIRSGRAEQKPPRYSQLDVWNGNKTPKISQKKMCINLISKEIQI